MLSSTISSYNTNQNIACRFFFTFACDSTRIYATPSLITARCNHYIVDALMPVCQSSNHFNYRNTRENDAIDGVFAVYRQFPRARGGLLQVRDEENRDNWTYGWENHCWTYQPAGRWTLAATKTCCLCLRAIKLYRVI